MTRPTPHKRTLPTDVPGLYVWQSPRFDAPHLAFKTFEGYVPSLATDHLLMGGIRRCFDLRFSAAGPAMTPWPDPVVVNGQRRRLTLAAMRHLDMELACFEQDSLPFQLAFHDAAA